MISRIFTPTLAMYLMHGKVFADSRTFFSVSNAALVAFRAESEAFMGVTASPTDEKDSGG